MKRFSSWSPTEAIRHASSSPALEGLRLLRRKLWYKGRQPNLPLVINGFPIALCWSEKAGCTTILKWFLAQNGLLEEATRYSAWVHDYREERLCNNEDYRKLCDQLFTARGTEKYIVKVIRDPARRAVSGYLHLLRYEKEKNWQAAAAVKKWKNANGLGGQKGVSFRQFLLFLSSLHSGSIDPHFRSQYEPRQDPHVDKYIGLEDLSDGLANLERIFHLQTIIISDLSDSSHHNPSTRNACWPGIPAVFPASRETIEQFGTPTAESLLDRETTELVKELFKMDYKAYESFYGS